MQHRKTSIIFPVLLTTVGFAWLLTVKDADPRIHWVPVLGMAVVGILTLALGGLDKVTVCVGPFLLICSGFAVARQTGHIQFDVMVPCLVIVAGVLMSIAHFLPLPYPPWLQAPEQTGKQDGEPQPKRMRIHEQGRSDQGEA